MWLIGFSPQASLGISASSTIYINYYTLSRVTVTLAVFVILLLMRHFSRFVATDIRLVSRTRALWQDPCITNKALSPTTSLDPTGRSSDDEWRNEKLLLWRCGLWCDHNCGVIQSRFCCLWCLLPQLPCPRDLASTPLSTPLSTVSLHLHWGRCDVVITSRSSGVTVIRQPDTRVTVDFLTIQ